MNLYCTQKVIDMLPTEVLREENVAGEQHWAANVIQHGRRKVLILMHTQTLYPMVITGFTQKHFKNLEKHFADTIRAHLEYEKIRPEVIEWMLKELDTIRYVKITNKKWISRLVQWGQQVKLGFDPAIEIKRDHEISATFCDYIMTVENNHTFVPVDEWFQSLRKRSSMEIFNLKAMRLRVRVEGTKAKVFRVITVPLDITYRQLHHVLLALCAWKGEHHHVFEIEDKRSKEINVVAPIHEEEDALDENLVKLTDFPFDKHEIQYFIGRKMISVITLESLGIFEGYNANFPMFDFGEGMIGPEAVDSGVFEAYLNHEIKNLPLNIVHWFQDREVTNTILMDREFTNIKFKRVLQRVTPSCRLENEDFYFDDFDDIST